MGSTATPPQAASLPAYDADLTQCSVSGLSSGAFMTVQLHLAHSAMFAGAGVIAGGPYRGAESFRDASPIAEDAYVQNAYFVCMNPLIAQAGPNPERLAELARQTARDRLIDPLALADQRLYIFTGSADKVVDSKVVHATRRFYELLGVKPANLMFVDDVPAGHAILTTNPEDNPLEANRPPYISRWDRPHMQSWDILRHIYGPKLKPPASHTTGRLLRFDQREFFGGQSRASMSACGYVYVPTAVEQGARCRVHVVLHGCKQGANYVNMINGRADSANSPPYGRRYVTSTGYNEIADANDLVMLYPQVEGRDDGVTQNPEGCWDWWGYSSLDATHPDYYSKNAIQISALHAMLQRLGGH